MFDIKPEVLNSITYPARMIDGTIVYTPEQANAWAKAQITFPQGTAVEIGPLKIPEKLGIAAASFITGGAAAAYAGGSTAAYVAAANTGANALNAPARPTPTINVFPAAQVLPAPGRFAAPAPFVPAPLDPGWYYTNPQRRQAMDDVFGDSGGDWGGTTNGIDWGAMVNSAVSGLRTFLTKPPASIAAMGPVNYGIPMAAPGMTIAAAGAFPEVAGIGGTLMRTLGAAGAVGAVARVAGTIVRSASGAIRGVIGAAGTMVSSGKAVQLAKRVGIDAAAAALGIGAVDLAQMVLQETSKKRRARGVSGADLRRARRTIGKITRMHSYIVHACRTAHVPHRRSPPPHAKRCR